MADDKQNDQQVEEVAEQTPVKETEGSTAGKGEEVVEDTNKAKGDGDERTSKSFSTGGPKISLENDGSSEASLSTESAGLASEEPAKPASKPVSKDLEKIIETIEKLSVLELADLVHGLEDRFGVSATATLAAGQAGASGAQNGDAEPQEEKTTFNVILTGGGANKIAVIKAVRELVPTLGLKEAKDLVEAAPKLVLEGAGKEAAEEAKTKLTGAGGTVELQ